MTGFFYVFIISVVLLAIGIVMTLLISFERRKSLYDDDDYVDKEGYHKYYERSIIRKIRFFRKNPGIPENEVRSFRRLMNILFFNKELRGDEDVNTYE